MDGAWLLTKLFYAVRRDTGAEDVHGDRLLVELVAPLFREVREVPGVRWMNFMRFSENGYHIRFRFYGDRKILESSLGPRIATRVAELCDTAAEMFTGTQALSGISATLNRKRSRDGEIRLFEPGFRQTGFLDDSEERALFESEEDRAAYFDFDDAACEKLLEILARRPPFQLRKLLLRQALDDLLRLAGLSAAECYLLVRYTERLWTDYFELGEQHLGPMKQYFEERRERYLAYFGEKKGPEESLRLIPESWREPYVEWMGLLRQTLPPLIRREPDGTWSRYSLLRLFAAFHLWHNRIGLGIVEEVFLAYLLGAYYRTLVSEGEQAEVEQTVDLFLRAERAGTPLVSV